MKNIDVLPDIHFSVLSTARHFSLEFKPRTYPKFDGLFNVYCCVYGQLTDNYIGTIPQPVKMAVTGCDDTNELIDMACDLIGIGYKPEIW